MVNLETLMNLYSWVVSPLDKDIKSDEVKDYLLKYYDKLPAQINEFHESMEYSYDGFIEDMFKYIEYSNNFIFALLNGGRNFLLKCLRIMMFSLIPVFIVPLFLIGYSKMFNNLYMYIIAGFFLFMAILLFSLNKMADKILKSMKPGDLLKILNAPDENFPMTKIERSLGPNAYETVTVVESKKRIICKTYQEMININKTKNLYKLMVYFIATNYLLNNEINEEIITDYRNKINKVLEYILTFRRESTYTLFYLAHNELNLLLLDKSLKHFTEYQNIYKDNTNVNAWIIVLKFLEEKNTLKNQNST
jgi:hypothetical protein